MEQFGHTLSALWVRERGYHRGSKTRRFGQDEVPWNSTTFSGPRNSSAGHQKSRKHTAMQGTLLDEARHHDDSIFSVSHHSASMIQDGPAASLSCNILRLCTELLWELLMGMIRGLAFLLYLSVCTALRGYGFSSK